MTGYLTHEANLARLEETQLLAEARRAARTPAPSRDEADEPISIRRATAADHPALERLAALDSAKAPRGEVLVAEVGGELRAAVEVATGTEVADPFHPTAHVVALLDARAAQLRDAPAVRRGLRRRLAVA